MAFMSVWLAGWSAGGVAAIGTISHHFSAFLLFWLCGWALGWVCAAGTLLWMFFGSERLAVINGDLQVSRSALWLSRKRLFQGKDIGQWLLVPPAVWPYNRYNNGIPFGFNGKNGAIRFTYGWRSYDLAAGMDDAEAGQILNWLKQRLPAKS